MSDGTRALSRRASTVYMLLIVAAAPMAQGASNDGELECTTAAVFCVDHTGKGLRGDEPPKNVRPGDEITVAIVVAETRDRLEEWKQRSSIHFNVVHHRNQLMNANAVRTTHDGLSVAQQASLTVPDDASVTDISVRISCPKYSNGNLVDGDGCNESYRIPVDHGRFYLQLGVLVAFVSDGQRQISARPITGSSLRELRSTVSTAIGPALSLTIFAGHRRNTLSPFQDFSWSDMVRDLVGLQLAKDFDFTAIDGDWYAGIVLQPVVGVGLGGGFAYHRRTELAPWMSEGMLVGVGEEPRGIGRHEPTWYIGVTVDQDVLAALKAALAKLQSLRTN